MAGETFQFEESYTQKYSSNVKLLLQDGGKDLDLLCAQGNYRGAKGAQFVQQFGETDEPHINLPRFSDTPIDSVPQSQVWIFPQTLEKYFLMERADQLKAMNDLESPITMAGQKSMRRAKDRIFLNATFADIKVGENGSKTVAFPSSQVIDVAVGSASATGLNVAKLKAAQELFIANEVDLDEDEVYLCITAKQGTDLLNDIEIINQDYGNKAAKPILDSKGRISSYLCFNFRYKEKLLTDSNSYRRLPAWCKSGMHWGWWEDIDSDVVKRGGKRHNWQVQLFAMAGCSREENKKVIEIKCSE